MSRPRLRVTLRSDGLPRCAAALEAVEAALRMQGGFDVRRDDGEEGGTQDAILLCVSRMPSGAGSLATDGDAPVVALPRWDVTPREAADLVAAGADDVLALSEISAARLEAVVRKAVGRRLRSTPARIPLREALPGTTGLLGPMAWTPAYSLVEADA